MITEIAIGIGVITLLTLPSLIKQRREKRRIDRRAKACFELGYGYGIRGLPPHYYETDTDMPQDIISKLDRVDRGIVGVGWSAGFEEFKARFPEM